MMAHTCLAVTLAAATLAPGVPATQTPAPAPLAGKWELEYHPSMCVLSRKVGAGNEAVTVAFRPWTMGSSVEVIVVSSRNGQGRGMATVGLEGLPKSERAPYIAVRHPQSKLRFDTMMVARSMLDELSAAKALTIKVGNEAEVAVPTSGAVAAMKALGRCEDDLLAGWGIENAKLPDGATGAVAIGDPARWVTQDDYPPEAISKSQSGTVTILWTIDTEGKVRGCRVVQSSGSPVLDQAGCTAITSHGRYRPAHLADGTPIPSVSTRRITWMLPS